MFNSVKTLKHLARSIIQGTIFVQMLNTVQQTAQNLDMRTLGLQAIDSARGTNQS
jgi:hypothetical protein